MRPMRFLWTVLLTLLLARSALAADFTASVVSVLDGYTIEVLHNQHPERIRLSGIDCPEKGQAYGHKAKQAASALVFGKDVTLQTYGKDKYRRATAKPSGCWGWCLSGWGNVLDFTAPS